MNGARSWVCVAMLTVCLVFLATGCKRTRVRACIRVDTQWASLNNLVNGTHPDFGGLTARIDIAVGQQRRLMSRLDSATQSAQSLRRQADRLANRCDEAVRATAQEAVKSKSTGREESAAADPPADLGPTAGEGPSGG